MEYADAFDKLSAFYSKPASPPDANAEASSSTGHQDANTALATITAFPRAVVVALAHAITYLSGFGIEPALLQTRFFARFAERTAMLLGANTLNNLYA
jgi:DNA mismatch repair protein MSH3